MSDTRNLMRRVAGYHDIRMDGISDLVLRARGASVLDIGCNRGLVGFEFANNGATTVHGIDNYEDGITTARQLFMDLRNCKSRFDVVDLTKATYTDFPFDQPQYDIVLLLATYHKLKRIMKAEALSELMRKLGNLTAKYFGWRGGKDGADAEIAQLDIDLKPVGLRRVHTSYIAEHHLGPAAIWERL